MHTRQNEPVETPFYIPATGPQTRPRQVLKHNDCFAVVDSYGDIGAAAGGPDGLFYGDTRYLGHLELLLNGAQMLLLGSTMRDDNSAFSVDLTNPDIYFENRLLLPKDTLHVVRTFFLWQAAAYQRLRIQNHGDTRIDCTIALTFGSDFADVFEVRGMRRPKRGTSLARVQGASAVELSYQGLDGRVRRTELTFAPDPSRIEPHAVSFALSLAPGEARFFYVTTQCVDDEPVPKVVSFAKGLRATLQAHRAGARGCASIETSNDILNEVFRRSAADLRMLTTATPEGPYPYAGIPWYSTSFGRDGLITAMQMLWCDPHIAKGVLRRLAVNQAKDFDEEVDAEPGKIVHEMRRGEMATLKEIPFGCYYGSVDSTPLFVLLAGLYVERTGDLETARWLWPYVERALAWIDGPGDRDADGFVEYQRQSRNGLVNQGWKDSVDAVFHADGSLADGPIALCEVQGYVYAAKRAAAGVARKLGHDKVAAILDHQADDLAAKFEEQFWCDDIGSYALALDGDKRACRVGTSNAGQVLLSGISSAERAEMVMRGLMRPAFFSGWGIRTVARDQVRYNPMSYHNGSVWPHDNSLIAMGLARYGHKAAAARIFKAMFEAASYMELRRLPELFCGFQRGRARGPTLYPVACAPQAWAAGAPFLMMNSLLGLEFNAEAHEIVLRNPLLPDFLDFAIVRNLPLGDDRIDFEIRRKDDGVSLQVLSNSGNIKLATLQ